MKLNSINPIEQRNRLKIIDLLRGFALLGVVLMNYSNYSNYEVPLSKTQDIVNEVTEYFFSVKSWSLLSLLFGFGFGALYHRIEASHQRPKKFFLKRMLMLLLISLVNIALYSGDILHDYALLGCLLLFFVNRSVKQLFITGLTILILVPATGAIVTNYLTLPPLPELRNLLYQQFREGDFFTILKRNVIACYMGEIRNMNYTITVHLQMLGMMLVGYASFRSGFFNQLRQKKKLLRYLCITSFLAVLLLIELKYIATADEWTLSNYYPLSWIRVDCTVLFLISSLCLLYIPFQNKPEVFATLIYPGRMTLTNYMVQNILILLLFSGAGLQLANKHTVIFYYSIAIIMFAAQAMLSALWLKKFRHGPVEWLWRCMSYGKWFKNKK